MSDFDASFEKLMAKIAEDALVAPSLMDKVDAAKVLQPYYALRKKTHRPPPEAGTMDALRNRIRAVSNEEPFNGNADAA